MREPHLPLAGIQAGLDLLSKLLLCIRKMVATEVSPHQGLRMTLKPSTSKPRSLMADGVRRMRPGL